MNNKLLYLLIIFLLIILIIFGFYYENRKNTLKLERQTYRDALSFQKSEFQILEKKFQEFLESRRFVYNKKSNITLEYIKTKNKKKLNFKNVNLSLYEFESLDPSLPKNPQYYDIIRSTNYIDYYNDQIYLITGDGVLFYSENFKDIYERVLNNSLEKIIFKNLPTNITDLITDENFYDITYIGIKDVKIIKDYLYVSHSNKVSDDCYNTAILRSKINKKFLTFEKYFYPDECVSSNNPFSNNKWSQGGRIVEMNGKIAMSQGTWGYETQAQNLASLFGKVIVVEGLNEYKIISYGHRNAQGLYYDTANKILLETEHGPSHGGDEVNVIRIDDKDLNYGWPISSYGDHVKTTMDGQRRQYRDLSKAHIEKLYKMAPLHKSHSNYGFIEPAKYFKGGVGISDITKISTLTNLYAYGTMNESSKIRGDSSLYFILFDNNYDEVLIDQQFFLNQRIRDLTYIDNLDLLIVFQESQNTIGFIDLRKIEDGLKD
jgi:hypothetical protein